MDATQAELAARALSSASFIMMDLTMLAAACTTLVVALAGSSYLYQRSGIGSRSAPSESTTLPDMPSEAEAPQEPDHTTMTDKPGEAAEDAVTTKEVRVRVHGVKVRPELNGRVGSVVRFEAATQRLGIQLEGEEKPLALKPGNLHPVTLPAGTRVRLTGLQAKPELNGQDGAVEMLWDGALDDLAVVVRLDSKVGKAERVGVKAERLLLLPPQITRGDAGPAVKPGAESAGKSVETADKGQGSADETAASADEVSEKPAAKADKVSEKPADSVDNILEKPAAKADDAGSDTAARADRISPCRVSAPARPSTRRME